MRIEVDRVAQSSGFAEDAIGQIMLAVDEALTNVIRHGYGGPCDKPIDVCISRVLSDADTGAGIRVTIRDFGKQVDPAKIVGRDLDDVRPGGLGVHIIRTVMDEVSYAPADGGGMQLDMFKRLSPHE